MALEQVGLQAILGGVASYAANAKTVENATRGIDASLTKAEGSSNILSRALGGLGRLGMATVTVAAAGALVGVTALTAGLASSVGEAIQAEEANAKLNAVLKATGGAAGVTAEMANDIASSLQRVTRFSDETVLSAEAVLLRFKNIGRDVFPQATEITLDLATALGIDASSAAVMLGKALEVPGEGLMRLKAAGVVFTDDQERMLDTMVRSGRTAEAQKFIMDALAGSIGGAARAAGETFAGKMDILRNKISDVKETIGKAVLPILNKLVDFISIRIVPALERLGQGVATFISILAEGDIGGAFDALAEFVIDVIPGSAEAIRDFGQLVEGVFESIRLLFTGDFRGGIFGLFEDDERLAKLFDLRDALGNLGAAIIEKIPVVVGAVQLMWQNVKGTFAAAAPTVIENVTGIVNSIAELWRAHGDTVIGILVIAWQFVTATVGGALVLLTGVVNAALAILRGDWDAAWLAIKNSLITFINLALAIVGTDIVKFLSSWEANWRMASLIVNTVWTNIKNSVAAAVMQMTSGIQNAIINIVNGVSQRFDALRSKVQQVWSAISGAISGAVNGAKGAIDRLIGAAQSLWNWLSSHVFNFKINLPSLPSWAIPGSPTPFEIGMRGIADAMKGLDRLPTPELVGGGRVNPVAMPVPVVRVEMPGGALGGNSVQIGPNNISSPMTQAIFNQRLRTALG